MAYNGAVWKDPRPIGRAATIALWCEFAVFTLNFLHDIAAPFWRKSPIAEQVVGWISVLTLIVVLVGAIIVMMWVYRVCRNTQALGLGANRSAWGALLWNLVPVASLFKPFETFSETWRIAQDPHGWRQVKAPPLLLWWWGLWLGQGFAGYFIILITGSFTNSQSPAAQIFDGVISNGLTIAYILLFLRVVTRLTAMQTTSRTEDVFD